MDFLKSLMLYMALTFAMGVQSAPAPGVPPQVTAVPEHIAAQSIGTATPKPEVTAAPTGTPKPADPTRSAPTLTPNTRYQTLRLGDRGNDVKKLQRRLIDLGYMKKGSDDGSYGYQTLNAVRDFQRANGLAVDGSAGRNTLTCLYEDPNVVYAPAAATETPAPTPAAVFVPVETAEPQGMVISVTTEAPAATEEAAETETTAAPEAIAVLPVDVTVSWASMENATVLLNGDSLLLLSRTNDVTTQRKPRVWLRGTTPMVSLDDLIAASGWKLNQGDVDHVQLTLAGYQVVLTAVGNTADGTCDAYTALVDGMPVALNDGDVVCSRNHWYVAPTFLAQTLNANAMWDADENTLIIIVQERSIANSAD